MNYIEQIDSMGACRDSLDWLRAEGHLTLDEAWRACPRGDWMDWLIIACDPEVRAARAAYAKACNAYDQARAAYDPAGAQVRAACAAYAKACNAYDQSRAAGAQARAAYDPAHVKARAAGELASTAYAVEIRSVFPYPPKLPEVMP